MKILFIAPYIPNEIRVRPYQWIRTLVQQGHKVTLVAPYTSAEDEADIAALRVLGVYVVVQRLPRWRSVGNSLRAIPSHVPLQAVYCDHPQLLASLQQLLVDETHDVIHVEHLRGVRYGLHAKAFLNHKGETPSNVAGQRIPVVWDSVDCISHLFEQAAAKSRSLKSRLMARLDLDRTRRYEGWLVHQFDRVLVTSSADKAALDRLAAHTTCNVCLPSVDTGTSQQDVPVTILPNGVDLDFFAPGGATPESRRVVFTGKMSYHANVTAAVHLVEDIMPRVWARRPDTEVWIVGKDPTPQVRALATTAGAIHGAVARRVVVTGTVPDVRPYLHQAALAVAPLEYGAGIQNKVLEAMACGTPVVASSLAVSALDACPGHDLMVADGDQAFADVLVELLDSPQKRALLKEAGRRYVQRHHSWRSAARQLEEVYLSAIAPAPWHGDIGS